MLKVWKNIFFFVSFYGCPQSDILSFKVIFNCFKSSVVHTCLFLANFIKLNIKLWNFFNREIRCKSATVRISRWSVMKKNMWGPDIYFLCIMQSKALGTEEYTGTSKRRLVATGDMPSWDQRVRLKKGKKIKGALWNSNLCSTSSFQIQTGSVGISLSDEQRHRSYILSSSYTFCVIWSGLL